MTFHTILIKIAFTFWRTIWRTHSVLPFIITTMMTIIAMSIHALIHVINYLWSFRLIIYCYHIHTIEWSKSASDFKVIICCYHILFKEWSKFNMTNFKAFHQNLSHHCFITMVHWLKLNVLSIQGVLRHNSMGLEPNPYHHGASKHKLMSYPLGAIELESIVLSSNIFHYGASGL